MSGIHLILIVPIKLYRSVLSPFKAALFGPYGHCRYYPTCSDYAIEAIRCHGMARGTWLAIKRLGRCHPWGGDGYDPIPPPAGSRRERNRLTDRSSFHS